MKRVLMFSATWCGPCRASKPVFKTLNETKSQYQYEIIDIDENSEMAEKFNISAVPTFVVLENEKEIDRVVGNVMKLKEIL